MLNKETILAMKENLKKGVTVKVAPQLFPTTQKIALKMREMLDLKNGDMVLEPSAGTGALIEACRDSLASLEQMIAVEINWDLCESLKRSYPLMKIQHADFLSLTPESLGTFDKIMMNPPFVNHQDVGHIDHAFNFLKEKGVLVSVVCEGPFFRQDKRSEAFRNFLSLHNAEVLKLPQGSFKESGTMVNARLIRIVKS